MRVLFNNGAGVDPLGQKSRGNPYPAYEKSFDALPIPTQQAKSWYFGPNQTMGTALPATAGVNAYNSDPAAVPLNDYTGGTGSGGLWANASKWQWDWRTHPSGNSLSYVTAPLAQNTTVIGAGAVELWARSSQPDVDFMVTVSEIDADGNETFVQNGFMRGSMRKLDNTTTGMFKEPSTLLEPHPSLREEDDQPMSSTAVHQGDGAAVLQRPPVPGRNAYPRRRLGAERLAADLELPSHQAGTGFHRHPRWTWPSPIPGGPAWCSRSSRARPSRLASRRAAVCATSHAARSRQRSTRSLA